MRAVVGRWVEERLVPGTLAVLWCGPGARGLDDAGLDLDLRFILDDDAFTRDWAGGRRQLRDVCDGRVIAARAQSLAAMARWRWDAALRHEYGRAQTLWESADGRVRAMLHERTAVAPQTRRRESLERYIELRELWQGFGVQLRRGDASAALLAGAQLAEASMRLYFSLFDIGQPARTWLLAEFAAATPAMDWMDPLRELLLHPGDGRGRRAAATLVELGRDAVHSAFHISRGRLDAWSSLRAIEPA